MLLRIPQALTREELAQVRQLIISADWTDGRITAGSQSGTVKNNLQLPEDLPKAQQARHIVSSALARNPMFITGALPKSVYPPMFNRYGGETNEFGMHVDNAVRTHAATAKHVRTDISCTLFLSDPASYDGGELVVQDTYGEQRIKFDAGDLVMYPGTPVPRCTGWSPSPGVSGWPVFSGLKAWSGWMRKDDCSTTWTCPSRHCGKKTGTTGKVTRRVPAGPKARKWFA
jgi:PKHD-type hydroxylase